MTYAEELFILSKFEHLRELVKLALNRADDRLLGDIQVDLDTLQMDIWMERDRRAGKPWAVPSSQESGNGNG